ncbi:hypothetical protein D3C77_570630 [compost metagenome]
MIGEALRQGDPGIEQQGRHQAALQARRCVQRQGQQGAEQVADVVPGGQLRALLQVEQAVGEKVRQQRGVGEAAQGMHHHQRGTAGQQGEENLTRRDRRHG